MSSGADVISPNELEAKELVGHEFADDDDRRTAVREMIGLGAGEALMTLPDGCLALLAGGAYQLVRASGRRDRPQVRAFGRWIKEELAALDWTSIRGATKLKRTS